MGKPKAPTIVMPPAPPMASPGQQTSETLAAQVEALPKLYETQMEWAPKFSELQYDLWADYLPKYTQARYNAEAEVYPESTALQEDLATQARKGMNEEVPDWMKKEYLSGKRAQLGANVAAPVGGDEISRGVMQLNKDWSDYYRNLGLSVTNRVPITTPFSQVQQAPVSIATPGQMLNYGASTYGSRVSNAVWQPGQPSWGQRLGGAMAGGIGGFATTGSPWGAVAGGIGGGLGM